MERPVNLREDTWQFLLKASRRISDLDLEKIAERPALFLFQAGIINHAELLTNMVLELENEVEYFIDARAAKAITQGDFLIILHRLGDSSEFAIKREKILEAFKNNNPIDYIENEASQL